MDNPNKLGELAHERRRVQAARFAVMNEIEDAIFGRLPTRFDDLFAGEQDIRIELRTIKTADQDLTALTKKVFPIVAGPTGSSEKARKNDERVEKIAYGWNNGSAMRGGPEVDAFMFKLAQYQVRFADGVARVNVDHNRKLVFFDAIDPRMHLPPEGWTPWGNVPLDETLIEWATTLGQLRMEFPERAGELNRTYSRSTFGYGGRRIPSDSVRCRVGAYYSKEAWYIATTDQDPVVLEATDEGDRAFAGVCPIVSFQQSESDPLFTGQVGIEVALQKVMSQEVEATEQMLHGPLFVSGLEGDINWNGVNRLRSDLPGEKPFIQRLGPTSPLNTERVLQSLVGLARVFNRNPESFQGAGDANSAKAVQTLQAGIRSTVQDVLWAPFQNGFPRLYDICLQIERKLWPTEPKKAFGRKGKASFDVDYIPATHLEGYEGRIKIEQGFGLGGYQATLDGLQRMGAGALSLESFMELTPDIRDVRSEMRRLEAEHQVKLMRASFEAMASQNPAMAISALAEIKRLIDSGSTESEAYLKVVESGALNPPEPEIPEGAEGMPPGLPPELMAMMGGAPDQAALPPAGVL